MGAPLHPPLVVTRKIRARPRRSEILQALADEVQRFAGLITQRYSNEFSADPRLKSQVAALLRRNLPPPPQRAGRPALAEVTAAIRLIDEMKRFTPERRPKEIWHHVYRSVIPAWDVLSANERRDAARLLRMRIRCRIYTARRRARAKNAKQDCSIL